MSEQNKLATDPYKTMCVVKFQGREVGRIPATARNAESYITELVRHYKEVSVDYVYDENAGFLAALHTSRPKTLGEWGHYFSPSILNDLDLQRSLKAYGQVRLFDGEHWATNSLS